MIVSLDPNGEIFAKQIAQIRRMLGQLADEKDTKATHPASARIALSVFVPFLTALRVELRADGMEPAKVLMAVQDTIANIAVTAMETIIDVPTDELLEEVEKLLFRTKESAAKSILDTAAANQNQQQRADQAVLSAIEGGKPSGPVSSIHDQRRGKAP